MTLRELFYQHLNNFQNTVGSEDPYTLLMFVGFTTENLVAINPEITVELLQLIQDKITGEVTADVYVKQFREITAMLDFYHISDGPHTLH